MPNPFACYSAPIPDAKAYLDRIFYTGSLDHTPETLSALVLQHLYAVPFEAVSIYHTETPPDLSTQALYRKVVTEHGGGYCFELNTLFRKLLAALGFNAWCVPARILLNKDFTPPYGHQVIVVELADGLYMCDVGYGGPAPHGAVKLDESLGRQDIRGQGYRVRQQGKMIWLDLEPSPGAAFVPLFQFSTEPAEDVDFLSLSHFASRKGGGWHSGQRANILRPEGYASITDEILKVKSGDTLTETVLDTEDALRAALLTWFGIRYDKPLRPWKKG